MFCSQNFGVYLVLGKALWTVYQAYCAPDIKYVPEPVDTVLIALTMLVCFHNQTTIIKTKYRQCWLIKFFLQVAAFVTVITAASAGQVYINQLVDQAHTQPDYPSGVYQQEYPAYHPQPFVPNYQLEKEARILSYMSQNHGHAYQYAYETENGN